MIAGLAEVRELAWRNSRTLRWWRATPVEKDSMRMLGVLQRELPELPIYCVLADTGFQHQTPISAESWGPNSVCVSRSSCPVELLVRNPNKTYLEMVERRGKIPIGAVPAMHVRPEAWTNCAIHSLTGIQGRHQLHGNSR